MSDSTQSMAANLEPLLTFTSDELDEMYAGIMVQKHRPDLNPQELDDNIRIFTTEEMDEMYAGIMVQEHRPDLDDHNLKNRTEDGGLCWSEFAHSKAVPVNPIGKWDYSARISPDIPLPKLRRRAFPDITHFFPREKVIAVAGT